MPPPPTDCFTRSPSRTRDVICAAEAATEILALLAQFPPDLPKTEIGCISSCDGATPEAGGSPAAGSFAAAKGGGSPSSICPQRPPAYQRRQRRASCCDLGDLKYAAIQTNRHGIRYTLGGASPPLGGADPSHSVQLPLVAPHRKSMCGEPIGTIYQQSAFGGFSLPVFDDGNSSPLPAALSGACKQLTAGKAVL